MWVPQGVAVSEVGDFYVADVYNSRIQIFDPSGKLKKMIGTKGSGPDNLLYPTGVAVTGEGVMYVTDSGNHRVQKISANGQIDSSFAAAQASAGFDFPHGIALGSGGDIWVTDSVKPRVYQLSSTGEVKSQFGERGEGPGQIRSPQGIAVDSGGHVYVSDTANECMSVFDSQGSLLGAWNGQGAQAQHAFKAPSGLSLVQSGSDVRLYVADTGNSAIDVLEVKW